MLEEANGAHGAINELEEGEGDGEEDGTGEELEGGVHASIAEWSGDCDGGSNSEDYEEEDPKSDDDPEPADDLGEGKRM